MMMMTVIVTRKAFVNEVIKFLLCSVISFVLVSYAETGLSTACLSNPCVCIVLPCVTSNEIVLHCRLHCIYNLL